MLLGKLELHTCMSQQWCLIIAAANLVSGQCLSVLKLLLGSLFSRLLLRKLQSKPCMRAVIGGL